MSWFQNSDYSCFLSKVEVSFCSDDCDISVLKNLNRRIEGSFETSSIKNIKLTYLDTGSDAVVIPKDIWLKLWQDMDLMAPVSVVGNTVSTWCTFIDLEFLKVNIQILKSFIMILQETY